MLPQNAPTKSEAVGCILPVNPGTFTQIANIPNAYKWRIRNISVGAEPATSVSTNIVGVGNATVGEKTEFTGYGNVYKTIRTCTYNKRSPVGGNLNVSWKIPVTDWQLITSTSTLQCPMVVICTTSPAELQSHRSWFEVELAVDVLKSS